MLNFKTPTELQEEQVTPEEQINPETRVGEVSMLTPEEREALERGRKAEELLRAVWENKGETDLPDYIVTMPEGAPKTAAENAFWKEVNDAHESLVQAVEDFLK